MLLRRSTFGGKHGQLVNKEEIARGFFNKKRDLWRVRDLGVWAGGLMGAVEGGQDRWREGKLDEGGRSETFNCEVEKLTNIIIGHHRQLQEQF